MDLCVKCDICQKTYGQKKTFLQHKRSSHNNTQEHFECAVCMKKCVRKDVLIRHIRCIHGSPSVYIYSYCGKTCTQKWELIRHTSSKHLSSKISQGFRCGPCNRKFISKKRIKAHYQSEEGHGIILESVNMKFTSFKKFESCKLDMQRESVTQFIVEHQWKNKALIETTKLFICHRLLLGKPTRMKSNFVKYPKWYCSKKFYKYCPSEITVKINHVDGSCRVKYMKTYVGHPAKDRQEMSYIFLKNSEKREIATKTEVRVKYTFVFFYQFYMQAAQLIL